MQKTQNYGLNKPDVEDFYNVDDMNDNMDVIDEELKKINDKTANVENKSSETIRNEITTENITHALGYVPATETELAEVNDKAEKAQSIAKGRNQAHVFSTTEAMKTWLSDAENKGKYNVGDNLYIVEVDVPDWWISEVLDEADTNTGYYYKIAQLETQKVDLTEIENEIDAINSKLITIERHEWYLSNMQNNGTYAYLNATYETHLKSLVYWIPYVTNVTPSSSDAYIVPWAENVTISSCKICCTSKNVTQAVVGIICFGYK